MNMNEYYKLKEENKNFAKKFRDENSKISILLNETSNPSNSKNRFHRKSSSLGCELFYNQNVNVSFREHYLKDNKKLRNIFDQNVLIIDDSKISDHYLNKYSTCRDNQELQKFREINKMDLKYLNKLTQIVNEKLTFQREDEEKKNKINDEVDKNIVIDLTTDFTNKFNLALGNVKEDNKTTFSPLKFNKTKHKFKKISNKMESFKNKFNTNFVKRSQFLKFYKTSNTSRNNLNVNSNSKSANNCNENSKEPKIKAFSNSNNINDHFNNKEKLTKSLKVNLNKSHIPKQIKYNSSLLGSNEVNTSTQKDKILIPSDKHISIPNLKFDLINNNPKIKIIHQHTKSLAIDQGDIINTIYNDKLKNDGPLENPNNEMRDVQKRSCGILQGLPRRSKNLSGTQIIKHQELSNRINSLNYIYDKINYEEESKFDDLINSFSDDLKIASSFGHNYTLDKDPYSLVKWIKEMKNKIKFFDLNERYQKSCEESGPVGDEILTNINNIK